MTLQRVLAADQREVPQNERADFITMTQQQFRATYPQTYNTAFKRTSIAGMNLAKYHDSIDSTTQPTIVAFKDILGIIHIVFLNDTNVNTKAMNEYRIGIDEAIKFQPDIQGFEEIAEIEYILQGTCDIPFHKAEVINAFEQELRNFTPHDFTDEELRDTADEMTALSTMIDDFLE